MWPALLDLPCSELFSTESLDFARCQRSCCISNT